SVTMVTRAMLWGHQPEMDDESYWKPSSIGTRFLNILLNTMLSHIAMERDSGWLEENRNINLGAAFEATKMEPTKANLKKFYDAQREKITQLEDPLANSDDMKTHIFSIPEVKDETKEWYNKREAALNSMLNKMKENLDAQNASIIKELE